MHCTSRCLLAVALACAAFSTTRAANIERPVRELSQREERMLVDARDGTLEELGLLDAALLANGILDPQQHQQLKQRIEQRIEELQTQLHETAHPLERATHIFDFMHERILVGEYQSDCTQLARALNEGNYNCVSATLLYHILCQAHGVNPVAVATPTHVYSRLHLDDQVLDVQTTCAQWFRMSPAQQQSNTPAADAAAASLPREISDVQLLAKVYYNRGVQRLEAQHFDRAEVAFRISLQLDPDDLTARENLLAALNNWALACSDNGDYAAAEKLLRRGMQIDDSYGPFRTNDLHIHQRWAQQLCEEGDFERAAQMLEQGRLRQPEAPLFRDGPAAVYRMWAGSLAQRGEVDGALKILDQGLRRYPGARELVADRTRLVSSGASQ